MQRLGGEKDVGAFGELKGTSDVRGTLLLFRAPSHLFLEVSLSAPGQTLHPFP